MKIDAIHVSELSMPLAYPFETSFGVTTGRRIRFFQSTPKGQTSLHHDSTLP